MASYQLTEDAADDVDGIYEYSIRHFGLQQARDYVNGLHACLGTLAASPRLGRDYSHVKAHVRRFEYQSHSVYYTITADGILVLRVLGASMDPARHL